MAKKTMSALLRRISLMVYLKINIQGKYAQNVVLQI
jgi:hypothetical protein